MRQDDGNRIDNFAVQHRLDFLKANLAADSLVLVGLRTDYMLVSRRPHKPISKIVL